MNTQEIRNIYHAIGLDSAAIDKRLEQSEKLSRCNPLQSNETKGGGVTMGFDADNGSGYAPIVVDSLEEAKRITQITASDVDTYTNNIPSSGPLLPGLLVWTPKMIKNLYKVPTINKITDPMQQGTFGVEMVMIPRVNYAGTVDLYDDFSLNGNTSVNFNYINRRVAYFEETLGFGVKQQAQYGLNRIDYAAELRQAMTLTMGQKQNDLAFQGFTGIPGTDQPMIWGVLNEPNLNPAITLPADGQIPGTLIPTTEWIGKDYSQVLRDVQLLAQQVITNAAGNATTEGRMILAIPPSAETAILTSTPYGVTVKEQLKKMFPRLEIVIIPNFEASLVTTGTTTNETVVMLMFTTLEGDLPFSELFVTKYQGFRPHLMPSATTEKVAFVLGGVVLKYPMLVSMAYGV